MGTVVVVAATVVIFAVASPAVAASAAGASAAATSKEKNKPIKDKESLFPSSNIDTSVNETLKPTFLDLEDKVF